MIKRMLRHGFAVLGFELRRASGWKGLTRTARRIVRGSHGLASFPPLRIEFFGASGAGKSFFGEELRRRRSFRDGWLADNEVLAAGLGTPETDPALLEAYLDLFSRQYAITLNSGLPVSGCLQMLSILARKLHGDLHLSLRNTQHWVLRNTGIFHNFSGALLEQCESSSGHFRRIVDSRVGIHCTAPAELIADRIALRATHGSITPQHDLLSRDELVNHTRGQLRAKALLAQALRTEGVPVLEIDLSADLRHSTEAVRSFLNELRQEV